MTRKFGTSPVFGHLVLLLTELLRSISPVVALTPVTRLSKRGSDWWQESPLKALVSSQLSLCPGSKNNSWQCFSLRLRDKSPPVRTEKRPWGGKIPLKRVLALSRYQGSLLVSLSLCKFTMEVERISKIRITFRITFYKKCLIAWIRSVPEKKQLCHIYTASGLRA